MKLKIRIPENFASTKEAAAALAAVYLVLSYAFYYRMDYLHQQGYDHRLWAFLCGMSTALCGIMVLTFVYRFFVGNARHKRSQR